MNRAIDRLMTLRVRDVMTRHVFTISADQSLAEVAAVFAERDISSAPVTDAQGRCVGVLSAVDFLKSSGPAAPADQRVRDCMSAEVRAIAGDELLLKAAQLMCGRHLHRLPVLGNDRRIEGVVSTMDIVSAMVNAIDEAEAVQFGARRD